MFGLFGKKATDSVWQSTALQMEPYVSEIAAQFHDAGTVVGNDPIRGWIEVEAILRSIGTLKDQAKQVERSFKAIGNPENGSPLTAANNSLKEFFGYVTVAEHWGKYHLNDASGGPGQRALNETGFAQRAALKRISNNGSQFASAATSAATAARMFSERLNKAVTE